MFIWGSLFLDTIFNTVNIVFHNPSNCYIPSLTVIVKKWFYKDHIHYCYITEKRENLCIWIHQ